MCNKTISSVFESRPSVCSIVFLTIRHMVYVGEEGICVHVHSHVCEFLSLEITVLSILVREWAALANYIVKLVENCQCHSWT